MFGLYYLNSNRKALTVSQFHTTYKISQESEYYSG